MSSLSDLVAVVPLRLIIGVAVSSIFFLLYFSADIFLFFTKRHFGHVNVYLVYFTKNDNKRRSRRRRSNALHFRIIDSFSLKQTYDNKFLFWRVILKSRKTTLANPVMAFGKYAYAALAPIRDHIVAKYAIGEIKRAAESPFKEVKFRIVMIYDRTEKKRRRILKVLMILDSDLKNIGLHLQNPPRTDSNFEMFTEVARIFQENPKALLTVNITVA